MVSTSAIRGTFRSTTYDRNDNPLTSADANGTVVARAFDNLDRLTTLTVTPSNGPPGTQFVVHVECFCPSPIVVARNTTYAC